MGEIKEFNSEELLGYIHDVDVISTSARATIYRGSIPTTGDIAAIFIAVKEYTSHDHWLVEKDCLTLCQHENIIKLLGWANTGNKWYLVFPYYPRGTLQCDTGDLRQRVTAIRGVASAMQYLQSLGYIHCNLQPKSILVGKDNTPVLCGFGSVLRIGSELPEVPGQILGYTNGLIAKVCPELHIMSFGVMMLQLVMMVPSPYINGQSILHLGTSGINFEGQKYVCRSGYSCDIALAIIQMSLQCFFEVPIKLDVINEVLDQIYERVEEVERTIVTPARIGFDLVLLATKGLTNDNEDGGDDFFLCGGELNKVDVTFRVFKKITTSTREFHQAELLYLSTFNHKNVMRIVGFGDDGRVLFLAYPKTPPCLLSRLTDLKWPQIINVLKGVASGLNHIHGCLGIIHGDLSPRTILVEEDGNPIIWDFSKAAKLGSQRDKNRGLGCSGYGDTLLATAERAIDVRSFGVVLLQLLMKRRRPQIGNKHVQVFALKNKRNIWKIVHPSHWRDGCKVEDAMLLVNLALRCSDLKATNRPSIVDIVVELGKLRMEEESKLRALARFVCCLK